MCGLLRIIVAVAVLHGPMSNLLGDELLTFEAGRLDEQFDALPKSTLARWSPAPGGQENGPQPNGRAVRLTAPAGGGFVTKAAVTEAVDWRKVEFLGLWLYRDADEAREHPTIELEVRLIEQDRRAFFWRRLEVAHVGWQQVLLPLNWFAWSQHRIPRWQEVKFLGFRLRDAGSVTIDTVWTEPAKSPRDEFLDAAEVARVAFPTPPRDEKRTDAKPATDQPRSLETRDVQLLTNAVSLDVERLAAQLKLAVGAVREELPFLNEPERGPVLVVLQSPEEFRQFVPRMARRFSLRIDPPDSDGYSLEGIGCSSWNDRFGTLRPVYVHEFLHAYLTRTTRLPLRGDWLHEGLATHFQLRLHPQDDLPQVIATGLSSSEKSLPLKELCDGRRLATSRYWQAATLCQLLLTDERYRPKLAEFFRRLESSESVDLAPHLKPVWNADWEQLTADWRKLCNGLARPTPKNGAR